MKYLPYLNALLNLISAILLGFGYYWIKRGRMNVHRRFMISAFLVSALFLISYLIFHYYVGSVGFDGTGWIAMVYYSILVTHILGATVLVPLVLVTLYRALRRNFDKHRRIARWTWPVWMYVSVTGVAVFLFMQFTGSYDKLI